MLNKINIDLEEAIETSLKYIKPNNNVEILDILDSFNRVLTQDIFAKIDNPPFDKSPLDGYAIISSDSKKASKQTPIKLKVLGEINAGEVFKGEIKTGEAVRIMTGAMMPKGADTVIRQEDTNYKEDIVEIYKSLNHLENYCFKGEDIKKDDKIAQKGDKITHIHIGVFSSLGIKEIEVYQKINIGLMTTGDEIVEANAKLTEGKIYNSNKNMLIARLKEIGFEVTIMDTQNDNTDDVINCINKYKLNLDFIITTGGASVGKKDIFHEVIEKTEAKKIFWRINMKPGTPAIFWIIEDMPILSLSGNPFASIATFELLARPILSKLSNDKSIMYKTTKSTMMTNWDKKSIGRRFIRAKIDYTGVYTKSKGHSSGMLGSMIDCNCLIDIPAGNNGLKKGDLVNIVLL